MDLSEANPRANAEGEESHGPGASLRDRNGPVHGSTHPHPILVSDGEVANESHVCVQDVPLAIRRQDGQAPPSSIILKRVAIHDHAITESLRSSGG